MNIRNFSSQFRNSTVLRNPKTAMKLKLKKLRNSHGGPSH